MPELPVFYQAEPDSKSLDVKVPWRLEMQRLRDPTPSTHDFEGKVAYQYVREPLTVAEADRLANACETPTERLIIWTLLDTGLHISELCNLTARDVLWQQRQLRFKGKAGLTARRARSGWCRCPIASAP